MTASTGQAVARAYHWRDDPFLRWRLTTYAALVGLAAVAWWITEDRASAMAMGMTGGLPFFLVTWVVMMAAMMFPSVAPMVATFVSVQRGRRAKGLPRARGGSALFVVGYLVTWSGFGLAVAALPALGEVGRFGAFWMDHARSVVAAVLAGSAVYELTPLKQACLRTCRSPVSFVLNSWRNGPLGALRMGTVHGGWCVGCCWGLMASLVALGLMSVGWMAVVALLIAVEKLLPWHRVGTALVAASLGTLSALVVLAPGAVPGLMA